MILPDGRGLSVGVEIAIDAGVCDRLRRIQIRQDGVIERGLGVAAAVAVDADDVPVAVTALDYGVVVGIALLTGDGRAGERVS